MGKVSNKTYRRTWKRETAWVLILWCIYLSIFGNVAALQVVVWPSFLFLGAAYGMDWASKQTDLTSRPSVREEEPYVDK